MADTVENIAPGRAITPLHKFRFQNLFGIAIIYAITFAKNIEVHILWNKSLPINLKTRAPIKRNTGNNNRGGNAN